MPKAHTCSTCCVNYLGVTCILCITYYSSIYWARKAEQVCVSYYIKPKNVVWETVQPYPIHDKYWQVLTSTRKPFITMKVFPGPFLYRKKCVAHSDSWLTLFVIKCTVLFLCSLKAKSRDAPHSKVDSEVVPKVARMTVSGKKQTMGFDVPR